MLLRDKLFRETIRLAATNSLPPVRLLGLLMGYEASTAHAFRLESTRMVETAFAFTVNNKIEGDYAEFGVFEGATFTAAWHATRRWAIAGKRLHAFDGFEGLPALSATDHGGPFATGEFAAPRDAFENNLRRNGVDMSRVTITQGMFDQSLTPAAKDKLALRKVNMAFIDCDLYISTVPVLDFLTDVLVDGAVLMFDDWHAFKNKPDQGEQLAVTEWLAKNPGFRLHPYRDFHWCGRSFILDRRLAGRKALLEDVDPILRLGAELAELSDQRLDVDLVLQVHLEVRLGARAVLQRLTVLAHDDERSLEADQDRERQIEELVRVRIERVLQHEIGVHDAPQRGEADEHEDELPAAVELGDVVGEAIAPREVLVELLVDVLRGTRGEQRVGLAKALAHLTEDGHRRARPPLEVALEGLAVQLEQDGVGRRESARAAGLVVEERELAEVLATSDVFERDAA
jgi:hypothetical protein